MDRNAADRIKDFNEVDLGFTKEEAVAEAKRCLQCKKPLCIAGCPVGINIPAFIKAIAEEKFDEAVAIIKEDNMLPAICGRVCPQETQCQGKCILGKKETPISIGHLERFVADNETERTVPAIAAPTNKKIAVVGSGPAGLSAATELARLGHSVTVFESLHEAGGVLMYGIPAFRLPKSIVQEEIDAVKKLGVEIKTNHVVGRSVPVDELLSYDAVFLGTGAGLPFFMGIEGENLPGVYSANEYLTRVNLMGANNFPANDTPVKRGTKVVVVGGGNVAMDAARVAKRMGADVTLMYRRSEKDMPARHDEIIHAKEEGIVFMTETNPVRFLGENNTVCGVEAVKMKLGEPGADGRSSFSAVEGSNFTVEADVVVQAIGQGPNPLLLRMLPELARNKNGSVTVDETGKTSVAKIYAGGDVATGAATVILAMGTAKDAARAIDKALKN
ncbi:MAG TPA: NADPH-dependent glutamate synthase [Methanocorpusculum sp.]|nr:NADPH-dependent glutamate synthase [Methanocorpusculum sp.]HJJ39817.1 NADPH-dependent glutamate synthase [Methanocorpusculum sp.]HJJ49427.1 NADPH-dependent glutamate synthase [Methanocorpusculum sp.]HJJ57499.1 NADPH-dependent glutamate synthase [Methanocorpusculum sp.]